MEQSPSFSFASLEDCHLADGTVVVIDVCRAFTTAAYAFGSGAERILLAGTVAEALGLRERFPGSLVMGEEGGWPVPGFDFWNSPVQLSQVDLTGKTLIQRTSSGTQGVVRSTGAGHLLAGSFAVAKATVTAIQRRGSGPVTFVITGGHPDDERYGIEDRACAHYMAALLSGQAVKPEPYLGWLRDMAAVHHLDDDPEDFRMKFYADIALCQVPDRFDFALAIRRQADLLVMEKEYDPDI
jgi:2-phosphosulfolactate phosphatase